MLNIFSGHEGYHFSVNRDVIFDLLSRSREMVNWIELHLADLRMCGFFDLSTWQFPEKNLWTNLFFGEENIDDVDDHVLNSDFKFINIVIKFMTLNGA